MLSKIQRKFMIRMNEKYTENEKIKQKKGYATRASGDTRIRELIRGHARPVGAKMYRGE